jgi:hypothetical protein
MKKIQTPVIIILLILTFSSCKKDKTADPGTPPVVSEIKLLKSIRTADGTGNTFTYNADGTLKTLVKTNTDQSIVKTLKYDFSYQAGKVSWKEYFNNVLTSEETLTLNGKKPIKRNVTQHFSNGQTKSWEVTYSYINDKIDKATYPGGKFEKWTYDNEGSLIKKEFFDPLNPAYKNSTEYFYALKTSKLGNYDCNTSVAIYELFMPAYSKYLVIKSKLNIVVATYEETLITEFSYQYNNINLVTALNSKSTGSMHILPNGPVTTNTEYDGFTNTYQQ